MKENQDNVHWNKILSNFRKVLLVSNRPFLGGGKNVEWKSKYSKTMQEYKLNLKIQSYYIDSM